MANAVRKICTKIGNGHHYLMGTTVKTAYSGSLISDTVQQHPTKSQQSYLTRFQVEIMYKPNIDSMFRPSQSLFSIGYSVHNKHNNRIPLTRSNSILTKSSGSRKPDELVEKGLPNADQLNHVYTRLGEDLPLMFKKSLDYSLYHPRLVFENNIRGTKSVGVEYFMSMISILRLMGHLKYAFVKFDILKITKHPEDGTIKIRWRIKGISGMKVFFKFWKFSLFNLEQVIKENVESWHDGFSIFYLGSDGKIHKLTADKMQPDNDPVIEEKNPLATKLALFLELSPQMNNFDCFMTLDSEQANTLLKMIIISLEDVF
ncbi:uncharacterized protein C6orf136 homolog isoform X3 [Sipha flava]|uniref:Uncharacterized protein C6orf136 homolog isoform X3 n=1 Tax=Sipha flava TaxID=143950 RepID=A0A8B8F740_9HEMI|nr:uncharacterized protein C6orf136 homolog isoform X3 [Sipha flava]